MVNTLHEDRHVTAVVRTTGLRCAEPEEVPHLAIHPSCVSHRTVWEKVMSNLVARKALTRILKEVAVTSHLSPILWS